MTATTVRISKEIDTSTDTWKLDAIKVYRNITDAGLKDSKDIIEAIASTSSGVVTELSPYSKNGVSVSVNDQILAFEREGYTVSLYRDNPRELLRKAAEIELASGEFSKASAIANFLSRYYS